jgi:cold shock CspA family protein
MPKAAKPVKAQKAPKTISKPAIKTVAKQEVTGTSKGARSGVVQEYNVLVGQGSITAQGEAEPVLVMFNCLLLGPDKKYPVLYPGDEVQFEIEEKKNRRNLLGQEFGPGKLAVNVRLVKAVPRQPVYRRVHAY